MELIIGLLVIFAIATVIGFMSGADGFIGFIFRLLRWLWRRVWLVLIIVIIIGIVASTF